MRKPPNKTVIASNSSVVLKLNNETREAVRQGRDQARRGEFVSDKDMSLFFKRHGVNRKTIRLTALQKH